MIIKRERMFDFLYLYLSRVFDEWQVLSDNFADGSLYISVGF